MAKQVILPKFGFTHESSQIVEWLVEEGEAVEKGDPLLEVTTDKVNMMVDAPATGLLRGIRYPAGEEVPTTEVIAHILAPGESLPELDPPAATEVKKTPKTTKAAPDGPTATPVALRLAQANGVDLTTIRGSGPGGRVVRADVEARLDQRNLSPRPRATPAARRIASERRLPLAQIDGSGPRGRVQAIDVSEFLQTEMATEHSISKIRQTIGQRMTQSFRDIPHFQVELDVDISRTEELRHRLNEKADQTISITAILLKAAGRALQDHPQLRARFEEDKIMIPNQIHVGVAVALDEGLIVPVVRDVDHKPLRQIAADLAKVAESARRGQLPASALTGSSFTISNLGMFGVDRFTAIINPPEAAILAVGQSRDRVVPDPSQEVGIAIRSYVTLRLSCDHRLLDGAIAARFLADLGKAIEEPGWLA